MSVHTRLRRLEATAPTRMADARRAHWLRLRDEVNLLQADPDGAELLQRMRDVMFQWGWRHPGEDRDGFRTSAEWGELAGRVRARIAALRGASPAPAGI